MAHREIYSSQSIQAFRKHSRLKVMPCISGVGGKVEVKLPPIGAKTCRVGKSSRPKNNMRRIAITLTSGFGCPAHLERQMMAQTEIPGNGGLLLHRNQGSDRRVPIDV